jgi:NAD(P)-dependent dehydrogenase (short-subunit alcohol dehydrogenase family)
VVDLAGQVAVVTGGSGGIGVAIVESLAGAGACVSSWSIDEHASDATDLPIVCDVTDPAAVAAAALRFEADLGPIDLLVNNAGLITAWGPLHRVPPEAWWRDYELHLRGVALPTRAVLPGMIARRRGRIASMASGMANEPSQHCSAYASAKCAVVVLMERIAAEVARHGVTAFAMAPGLVRTGITNTDGFRRYTDLASAADRTWQTPAQAANLVIRIAAGDADPLTGRFLHVKDDLDQLLAEAAVGMADGRLRMRRSA